MTIRPRSSRRSAGQQIHGDREFDRVQNRAYPSAPSLQVQFHAPVRFSAIRGSYHISIQLEAPAVVWGQGGRCWAFLHDFDDESVQQILAQYRFAAWDRRGPAGHPFGIIR